MTILVFNYYGERIDFDAAVQFMDDEIRERLHVELAPCDSQYFYERYCEEHKKKYGEDFFTEEKNIVW